MSFTIAIIGRPNVGKSTLFNRLTGRKYALVDDLPGVTRDRREGNGYIASMEFRVIDTPGLEEAPDDALETRMMHQTEAAIDEADLCLMMMDGRQGLTPADKYFAGWLRKKNKQVILVVNKCEGDRGDHGVHESFKLGFKEIVPISAEHNDGMADLYDAISPYKEKYEKEVGGLEVSMAHEDDDKFIQIAIVGRPNTGKSTLLNKLFGSERVLTGPEAGITRDSIAIDWQFEGKNVRLIDTAGIRRRANVTGKLEKLSVADSLRALRYAHIAVLMIDVTSPFDKQDLAIAETIIKEGRAIVIGVNKWDTVKDKPATLKELKHMVDMLLPDIKGVPLITMSAKTGDNITAVIKRGLKAYEVWNRRITTNKLNNWLHFAQEKHMPPLGKNKRRIKLKYITQGNSRPPTFTIFANMPGDLPDSYKRYIMNALRDDFGFPGVPMRVMFRASENPYENKKKKS